MTIMGMAASQARFLGLTARKSNVEYQVQQINQQRTSLANESAGLYNQMMEMTVPTPPNVNEFYETTYTLDGSEMFNGTEDYKILSMANTYNENGEYYVTLLSRQGSVDGIEIDKTVEGYSLSTSDDNKTKTAIAQLSSSSNRENVSCVRKLNEETGNWEIPTYGADGTSNAETLQIYKIDENGIKPNGYEECSSKYNTENYTHFYKNAKGESVFLTDDEFKALFPSSETNGEPIERPEGATRDFELATTYTSYHETTIDVTATFEESSIGRLSSIRITDTKEEDSKLKDKTFNLTAKQEYNEKEFEQATNDYEYEKALYEKRIADINSKTKSIQAKDQSLELKIQQLDTEQNAISTEMDSVQKIIENNVEKTFNVFG